MKTILSLALFLVIGFIASKGLFTRAKLRLPVTMVFLTGVEFFFLGVLLGPNFFNLISVQVLEDLKPVAYLALGWAGLLFGLQLSRRHLQRLSRSVIRFLIVESVVTTVACAAVLFVVLKNLFPDVAAAEIMSSTAVLAVTAAISSPTIVSALSNMMPSRGRFTTTVKIITSLSAVVPLLVFGIIFTIAHPGFFVTHGFASGALWWLFANAVGVIMGFVFAILLAQKIPRDERLLIIMGTTLFVGGLCYFLQLSALYTTMIMGVVLGNFSRRRVQLFEQLLSFEKTLYIAFLILIGAMVSISSGLLVIILCSYVLVRLLLKTVASNWLLGWLFPEFKRIGSRAGFAFSAQGAMALAVALDYGLGTEGRLVEMIVAVVAAAVVLNEFIGVVVTRAAFRASGEVRERRAQATKNRPVES